jgi:hypothetical protein
MQSTSILPPLLNESIKPKQDRAWCDVKLQYILYCAACLQLGFSDHAQLFHAPQHLRRPAVACASIQVKLNVLLECTGR